MCVSMLLDNEMYGNKDGVCRSSLRQRGKLQFYFIGIGNSMIFLYNEICVFGSKTN